MQYIIQQQQWAIVIVVCIHNSGLDSVKTQVSAKSNVIELSVRQS